MCEQYELKENEAQLLKSKIEQSTFHKQIEELQKMKESLGKTEIYKLNAHTLIHV